MSWIVSITGWLILLAFVLGIAIYRVRVAHHLDISFHVVESDKAALEQMKEEKAIRGVDFWGKLLTAIVILYGIGLAVAYGFHMWNQQPKWP